MNLIVEMCSWGVKGSVPVNTPFVIAKGLCINIPMPSAVRIDAQNVFRSMKEEGATQQSEIQAVLRSAIEVRFEVVSGKRQATL